MDEIFQYITLAARTFQGITPIFQEYALWIAIFGLFIFSLGETFANIIRYRDSRITWIASAFGVSSSNVLPIASSYLMGLETIHPKTRQKNPFRISNRNTPAHQGDYIVRGDAGATVVSVYNWRAQKALNSEHERRPGYVKIAATEPLTYLAGHHRVIHHFSPDEDTKSRSATLNAQLVARFGSQVKIGALCLHKNRPPKLTTRSPRRGLDGRSAAHIDIEQIRDKTIPVSTGGKIDDETWHDLRVSLLRQPARMMSPISTIGRILIMLALLSVFAYTESTTISEFEIKILIEAVSQKLSQFQ